MRLCHDAAKGQVVGRQPESRGEAMGIQESVATCFSKYVDFHGRARRSEYWWWVVFIIVVVLILRIAGGIIMGWDSGAGGLLSGLFYLATLLPGLAVSVRRLHDTDRSGWWLLLGFIPIVGGLVLLYFMVQPGTLGPNRFGDGAALS
jgi:uncharacterized membrane protein YhaH (DUF805 family)